MGANASPPGGSHSLGFDDIDDEALLAAIRQVEAATGRSVAPTRAVASASEDEAFFAAVRTRTARGSGGRSSASVPFPAARGSRVMRDPSWDKGDQDGGVGRCGLAVGTFIGS